ncbi:hypothetical protein U9M48_042113 [Paspalum notatum var. saurae]|uniref:Uncharacterized protein n=1 Tax=Paspalum notatum var. saurae TaxID=547442 RepID=A0AAQ3UQG0_PASNO
MDRCPNTCSCGHQRTIIAALDVVDSSSFGEEARELAARRPLASSSICVVPRDVKQPYET